MGEKTGIEFADKTWNPWQGCHKVSPGCDNCYMYREKIRYGQEPDVVVRSKPPTFNAPLKWKEPEIVFTASWSDWFIREADDWRAEAWDIIRRTPHLFYLVFTKRPQNIPDRLPPDWGSGYPNVMLVVTTENQEEADRRIPYIQEIPAAYRGASAEPLLGWLNLIPYLYDRASGRHAIIKGLDWVVAGGESGPGARPSHPDWFRNLRTQCVTAGVPFFFKQWGEWEPVAPIYDEDDSYLDRIDQAKESRCEILDRAGTQWPEFQPPPGSWMMERIGKKNAGRLLDGREWSEFPEGVKR